MDKRVLIAVGAAVAGLGAGYGVGVVLTRKKYVSLIDEEVEKVRQHYTLLRKEEFPTPASVLGEETPSETPEVEGNVIPEDLLERVRQYHGQALLPPEETVDEVPTGVDGEPIEVNIWDNVSAKKNYTMPAVTPDKPYAITEEEYMTEHIDGLDEYKKIGLTYWVGDNTLTDEGEQIVPNLDELIGESNLEYFGKGTNDPDALYVRNEKRNTDFEVMKTSQSYSVVVLGTPDDRKSSRSQRKMRDDDE